LNKSALLKRLERARKVFLLGMLFDTSVLIVKKVANIGFLDTVPFPVFEALATPEEEMSFVAGDAKSDRVVVREALSLFLLVVFLCSLDGQAPSFLLLVALHWSQFL